MTDIVVITLLILLNGLFSMTEMALVSARKTRLAALAAEGRRGAAIALKLTGNPDRFLSTIQIGITLIGILTGLYSGSALSERFGDIIVDTGVSAIVAYKIAQVAVVIIVTYLSIVVGELVPKRIGLAVSDKVAVAMAPAMKMLSTIAHPFVWFLSCSTEFCTRVLAIRHNAVKVTEEEIKSMVQEGTEAGEVKEVEQDIIERVLVLGDQTVNRIMTNRADIVSLNCRMTSDDIRRTVYGNLHNAYPYYCGDIREVKGILVLKDILEALESGYTDWENLVKTPTFFPESMTAYDALEVLRNNDCPCGLVCDEFGVLQGVVTLRDVLEGLVGIINDPVDTPAIVPFDDCDNDYLVDGLYKWYDFLAYINRDGYYEPAAYSTVGGWILHTCRHIPVEGEEVLWRDLKFKIVDMDGARIDKILVSVLPSD